MFIAVVIAPSCRDCRVPDSGVAGQPKNITLLECRVRMCSNCPEQFVPVNHARELYRGPKGGQQRFGRRLAGAGDVAHGTCMAAREDGLWDVACLCRVIRLCEPI